MKHFIPFSLYWNSRFRHTDCSVTYVFRYWQQPFLDLLKGYGENVVIFLLCLFLQRCLFFCIATLSPGKDKLTLTRISHKHCANKIVIHMLSALFLNMFKNRTLNYFGHSQRLSCNRISFMSLHMFLIGNIP